MAFLLYLYISSCHKAHKALTFSFHPLRFAAKALTVVHDCHPATRLSSSTILLHVVFGRPGLLLPSGLHSNAVTQCSSLFFLNICPIQFHLRRLILSLVLFTPVVSWICWCEMVRGHLILSMRGTLGCIRNRKTEEKIIQNRKKFRPKPRTAYKTVKKPIQW